MVKCPSCNSTNVSEILYGMPTYEAFEMAERGELLLGGCEVCDGQPDYGCLDCKFQWSKMSLPASAIKKLRFKVWENGPGFLDMMKTWVYEIHCDGKIVKYTYYGSSRKYTERREASVSEKKLMKLYNEIQKVVSSNSEDIIVSRVCDGSSYQLQVSYIDGSKEILDGDIGGDTIYKILVKFISREFDEVL
jgi:hypothetical protein